MQVTTKKLPKSQVELTIEVGIDQLDKYLQQAAQKISRIAKVDGWRPGKAPYDVVKKVVGEMSIYQEALDLIIRDTLFDALEKENLEAIGQPQIDIDKLAPGNPVVYRATITLLPTVTIKDYKNVKVKPKEVKVDDDKVEKTLTQLQKMRATEVVQDKTLAVGDKAIIDFTVYLDKVPIDGGQHNGYQVYIGENLFVPGFEDNIIGMKKGETKEFALKFPKDYFQKNLAGKNTEVKVKVNEIYQVTKPELNDEFAKSLGGYETFQFLKDQIKQNITEEEMAREQQRLEMEILDNIILQSEFAELPQMLIESEIDKMRAELEYNISQQGMKFEDYLTSLKISEEELLKNFTPQAEKRLKTSLLLREIGEQEKIEATEEDIAKEIDQMLKMCVTSEQEENARSEGYRRYLKNLLANRKVIERLKEWNVEK